MSADNIKTDNGWYHIDDHKPNSEEEVVVIEEYDQYSVKAFFGRCGAAALFPEKLNS